MWPEWLCKDISYHKNPANARYCETCGNSTEFLKQDFLKPWEECQREINDILAIPGKDDIPY